MVKPKRNNKGIALVFSLGILALLAAMGASFLFYARLEEKASANRSAHVKCALVMRAGMEHAFAVLKNQRDDGYDSFRSDWRVVFEGSEYDNSGNGAYDSRWIEVRDPSGEPAGRYAVLIEDESGKINLNHSGNLSVEPEEGAREHGQNHGWSSYEISVEDVFHSLGFPGAKDMAAGLVEARYGGYPDAGEYGFNLGKNSDGIDNDAGGKISSVDPMGFTPWKPNLLQRQDPFLEFTHPAASVKALRTRMGILSSHACVYSRSAEQYVEDRVWKNKVNLNAYSSPGELYRAISAAGGISDEAACRIAVNALDYRDENIWLSEFQSPSTGNIYYGVESLLINELLCNSYMADDVPRVNNTGSEMTFTYSGLAPDTAYRVTILFYYQYNPANVKFRVGAGAWQNASPGGAAVVQRGFNYLDIENSLSDSEGNITISVNYNRTRSRGSSHSSGIVTILRAEFTAAEFVELVNISGGEVFLDGWEIEVVSGGSSNIRQIPPCSIEPGGYLVLTNDLPLFTASYGRVNAAEIEGWRSGFATSGEFDDGGDVEVYLYIDRARGLLADLILDGQGRSMPGISAPGPASGIGVSREKRDPASRTFWFDNYHGRASPGRDNSMVPGRGVEILSGLRDGSHPPLIKNKPFHSSGELILTQDWRTPGEVKYPGLRTGEAVWAAVSADELGRIADRVSAGYFLRFDGGAAELSGSVFRWPARLDKNFGEGEYGLFFYGDYSGSSADVCVEGRGCFAFEKSGGAPAGALHARDIAADGSFGFNIAGDFEYALLLPDSIHGRININTASFEVLGGLPSVCAAAARAVISSRESSPFSSPGELLLRGVLDPSLFAPIGNLITVRSDVFRVICTARIPHPSDPEDPGLFTAERRVEAVIDRSGGRIRVVSWKEIFE